MSKEVVYFGGRKVGRTIALALAGAMLVATPVVDVVPRFDIRPLADPQISSRMNDKRQRTPRRPSGVAKARRAAKKRRKAK